MFVPFSKYLFAQRALFRECLHPTLFSSLLFSDGFVSLNPSIEVREMTPSLLGTHWFRSIVAQIHGTYTPSLFVRVN